jgi:N-acetylglutamate synthase-like GNAT family acetyltransferase
MIVRAADKWDTPDLIEMLRHYRTQTTWPRLAQCDNEVYIRTMLAHILAGAGCIFVSEKDKTITGMLVAIKNNSVWDPDLWIMQELCYWVEPEYRGSTAGYRLIKQYVDHCDQLKQQGQIEAYTISRMVNSPDLNYSKFGFDLQEEHWRA